MKKILAALFLTVCVMVSSLPSNVIASTNKETSNKQENDKKEDIEKVFKKLGIKPLSDAQVKALNLDSTKITPFSGSLDEIEKYLIQSKQKQPQQPIIENSEFHIQVNQDILNTEVMKNFGPNFMSSSLAAATSTSITRQVTKTYSYTAPFLTNARSTISMPATYEYTYTAYPAGPPESTNYHFTSCGDGTVYIETVNPMMPYMYQLERVNYANGSITSASSLQLSYQYVVGLYHSVGIPNTPIVYWWYDTSNTITGTTNYYLDI